MFDEENIEVEDIFKNCYDSDHIGKHNPDNTSESDLDSVSSDSDFVYDINGQVIGMKGENNELKYYDIFYKNSKDTVEKPRFQDRNRIAYIKHCIDDISDLKYEDYIERKRKCRTAIGRLPIQYREYVKQYVNNKRMPLLRKMYYGRPVSSRKKGMSIGTRLKLKKDKTLKESYYNRCKEADAKLSKAMCNWLKIKEFENVHEDYEKIKERVNLLNSVYDEAEHLYFRKRKRNRKVTNTEH